MPESIQGQLHIQHFKVVRHLASSATETFIDSSSGGGVSYVQSTHGAELWSPKICENMTQFARNHNNTIVPLIALWEVTA